MKRGFSSGAVLLLVAGFTQSALAEVIPRLGNNSAIAVPVSAALESAAPSVSEQFVDGADTRFAVVWIRRDGAGDAIMAALVDELGVLRAGPSVIAAHSASDRASNPAVAVDDRGYFSVAWTAVIEQESSGGLVDFNQAVFSRTLRFETGELGAICPADGLGVDTPSNLVPQLDDTLFVPDLDNTQGDLSLHNGPLTVAMDSAASGRTLVVFPDHRSEPHWGLWAVQATVFIDPEVPEQNRNCSEPHAWLEPDRGMYRITGTAEAMPIAGVAVNENNDRAVVTWRSQQGAILAQRIDQAGNLESAPIVVAPQPGTYQESLHDPDVDYGITGSFRVVWERSSYRNDDREPLSEIRMSSFSDSGISLEENVILASEGSDDFRTMRSLRHPRIMTNDLDGDFAVTWSRQQNLCPEPGFDNWYTLTVASSSCPGGTTGTINLPLDAGRCTINLLTNADQAPQCRAQVRLIRFSEDAQFSGLAFSPDQRISWDDFGTGGVQFDLEWLQGAAGQEKCALLVHSDPLVVRTRLVRQDCDLSYPGAPAQCLSCEQQAQALGIELPATAETAVFPQQPLADRTRVGSGVIADADIRLRWFQSDWQADIATTVEAVTINTFPSNNGRPALGMGGDSDMLLAWLSNNDPAHGEIQGLMTQAMAGPVELSVNDVGILEGPLGRATANFTVSANKPYPILSQDCDDDGDPVTPPLRAPQPSVTLLTANDSATFQSGDYERTTRTLTFADRCDPKQSWESQLAFSVSVTDDSIYEDTESFFVDLFDEANAIVVRRQGLGAIVDNDLPAVVQPPSSTIYVCEDGNAPIEVEGTNGIVRTCPDRPPIEFVEVPVELSTVQEVEGTVEFISVDGQSFGSIGGAQAPADYEAVTGELQFLPGNDRAFLSIDLLDDGFAELTEEFFVELIGAEDLTLPEALEDRRITVRILDNDECSVEPQWVLPDGTTDPQAPPPAIPQVGDGAELSGYVCVINPDGYAACPWASRLDLSLDDGFWLTGQDIPFDPPSGPGNPPPPSPEDIASAQQACSGVAGATGAIRFAAEPNLPTANNANPATRTGNLLFINGRPDPFRRVVSQEGSGACQATVTPSEIDVLPVGGELTLTVDFGESAACAFSEWSAVLTQGGDFVSIDQVSTSAGNGEVTVTVQPYTEDMTPGDGVFENPRFGNLLIASVNVPVRQEAPLFDHFDDETPPSASLWQYTEQEAWTEAGTQLTAGTDGLARLLADPVYPGCTLCLLDTTVRFDEFSKGRATIYLWWQSEDDHLRLVADEFFDRWTLTQRVAGMDHELRRFASDIEVGVEYPVRIEFRDDLGAPLITVDVGGEGMCTVPQAGPNTCLPYDADPDPEVFDYVIGSGTVGLQVEATRASFNLLRVIRANRSEFELDRIFSDRFGPQ